MPFGQLLLDLRLALFHPVHRGVEGLGLGLLHLAEFGQGARVRFLVEPPSRRELGARIEGVLATIIATTRLRSSDGAGAMSVSSLSLRSVPSTAATCPWGRERSISKLSWNRSTAVPPRNRMRSPSTMFLGTSLRLAIVRLRTFLPRGRTRARGRQGESCGSGRCRCRWPPTMPYKNRFVNIRSTHCAS